MRTATPPRPAATDHSACQSCRREAAGLHSGPCPDCGDDAVCAFMVEPTTPPPSTTRR